MNKAIDKTNLGYLGSEFQYRLVKCFIEEPGYFASIYSVVEQNTFTEPLLRQFVGALKDYYNTTSATPSYETMLILLKQRARMESELEEWDDLVAHLKEITSEGSIATEETATRFFKQQNMIKVANDIIKKTQDGDLDHYEECAKMMEDVLHVGEEDDLGFNPYDIIDEVMHPNADIPIPTGVKHIDDLLNGGLYKGHLGLVLGPSGFGKTTYSTAIASYASTYPCDLNDNKGWKVLQICFEDDMKSISKKHFSRITQVEARDLTNPAFVSEAREVIEEFVDKDMFRNNLVIKKFKTNTKSVDDIRSFIKKLINSGFRPDEVILDYFECLKLVRKDRNDSKWDLQESAMRQLEVLAEEFNVALWIMTQGNKESFASEIVRMDQAGGSVTKVQIGHVILSIARSLDDMDNNKATIAMLKNRQGKSGPVFKDIKFNNGTSTISCDEVEEFDNSLTYQETMANRAEETRMHLMKKIQDNDRTKHEKQAFDQVATVTSAILKQAGEVKDTTNNVSAADIKKAFEENQAKPVENTPKPEVKNESIPAVTRKPVEPDAFKLKMAPEPTYNKFFDSPEELDENLTIDLNEWESGIR